MFTSDVCGPIYAEIAWVLVSLGTQVQPQVMLDPDYLPDYLSVSYDYAWTYMKAIKLVVKIVSENTLFLKNKFSLQSNR